jgi:hypothetical protein
MTQQQKNISILMLYIIGTILILLVLADIGALVFCLWNADTLTGPALEACTSGNIKTFALEIVAAAGALWAAYYIQGGRS